MTQRDIKPVNVTARLVFDNLPKREREAHKGDFGRLLNIAGSTSYTGSALLSTASALKCGCGYVYLASVENVIRSVTGFVPEAVTVALPENFDGTISAASFHEFEKLLPKMTAVAYGCGMSDGSGTLSVLKELIAYCTVPLIIDADGLNALSQDLDILGKKTCKTVLTPHIGEFSRLCGKSIEEIKQNKIQVCLDFANYYNTVLLLKGADTLIASPDGELYISASGCPGMAKAGSGDALTGVIGALLARGIEPVKAAYCGAWLHGAAGSLAQARYSETAMTASELISFLPEVFKTNGR